MTFLPVPRARLLFTLTALTLTMGATLPAQTTGARTWASSAWTHAEAGAPDPMAAASAPVAFAAVAQAQPFYAAPAEGPLVTDRTPSSSAVPSSSLPDDPASTLRAAYAPAEHASQDKLPAPKYAKYIASNETAQPLRAQDKLVMGLRDTYAPLNIAGMLLGAGYEQVLNSAPNYGTDRGAFGERLGAAGIRQSAEEVLVTGVFAPMFHTDPRYYALGPSYSFMHRAVYAGTRIFVTRTDSGRTTFNTPLFLGYAGSAALTPAYYPRINRNFNDVASGYGGSLAGAALGFVVDEFANSFLKAVHMESREGKD